ncbi:hypothetical protein HX867_07805 [Pseudomonas gingeri]|uniref:hypothetical protein n=1 Tax=Pseudomonas gingeri TaxID=117681 RepID=UPI0015A240F2|nr:hypothetical protein [Pseudomonas gingeri]NVZ61986.1 hypothetical protein [Pseudomonas gingeri]NVZ73986.1 hypothetical protein [Pseudomonas gingeri]
MSKSSTIIEHAERDACEGKKYNWAPFTVGGGIGQWLVDIIGPEEIGQSAEAPICCFEYPLLLCIKNELISKATMQKIFNGIINNTKHQKSGALSYWGYKLSVWQDWSGFPKNYWRPRRGDIVFFNEPRAGDLNHVVLACGTIDSVKNANVISFGAGLEVPQVATVVATTIENLKQKGHASVKFTQPIWA